MIVVYFKRRMDTTDLEPIMILSGSEVGHDEDSGQ